MPSSPKRSGPPPAELDHETLYGDAQRSLKRKADLALKVVHKALNIPWDDDMIVNQQTGWGWRELAILGVLAVAGALGWAALARDDAGTAPPPQVRDTDTVRTLELRPLNAPPRRAWTP